MDQSMREPPEMADWDVQGAACRLSSAFQRMLPSGCFECLLRRVSSRGCHRCVLFRRCVFSLHCSLLMRFLGAQTGYAVLTITPVMSVPLRWAQSPMCMNLNPSP